MCNCWSVWVHAASCRGATVPIVIVRAYFTKHGQNLSFTEDQTLSRSWFVQLLIGQKKVMDLIKEPNLVPQSSSKPQSQYSAMVHPKPVFYVQHSKRVAGWENVSQKIGWSPLLACRVRAQSCAIDKRLIVFDQVVPEVVSDPPKRGFSRAVTLDKSLFTVIWLSHNCSSASKCGTLNDC